MGIAALNIFETFRGAPSGRPASLTRWDDAPLGRPNGRGFGCVERLGRDVGYIEVRSFRRGARARESAAALHERLSGTRALIIDLRRSRGGDRSMVALLTSVLFDTEAVHRDAICMRPEQLSWSPATVEARWATQELYVLVSRATDALGRAFAANLQRLGRALLVGETTGAPRITPDILTPAAKALSVAYRAAVREPRIGRA